jgi:hypothetical protein
MTPGFQDIIAAAEAQAQKVCIDRISQTRVLCFSQ